MTTYTGSATANLSAITLTPTAIAAGEARGVNLAALLGSAQTKILELDLLFGEILKIHPSTGPDAANFAALQAVQAELYP